MHAQHANMLRRRFRISAVADQGVNHCGSLTYKYCGDPGLKSSSVVKLRKWMGPCSKEYHRGLRLTPMSSHQGLLVSYGMSNLSMKGTPHSPPAPQRVLNFRACLKGDLLCLGQHHQPKGLRGLPMSSHQSLLVLYGKSNLSMKGALHCPPEQHQGCIGGYLQVALCYIICLVDKGSKVGSRLADAAVWKQTEM